MIYISIGSNQGDRLDNLRKATNHLQQLYCSDFETSIVLETKAILPINAPNAWDTPYLNMVVRGKTKLSPEVLLRNLQIIEIKIGRQVNADKWAPRIIDLDILLWDSEILSFSNLQIPHPELFNRAFLIHLIAMIDCQYYYSVKDYSIYSGLSFGEIALKFENIQSCFIRSFVLEPKLVGIVNITMDSFSDGNLYLNQNEAIEKVGMLINEGASIVELGPQSTNPASVIIDFNEEWRRLKPILDEINARDYSCPISIDSFSPEIILKTLEHYNIFAINDVSGTLDDATLRYIAGYGCKIIIMHSLTIPPNKNNLIRFDIEPIDTVYLWAELMIKRLISLGFSLDQIIIDPGLGFAKSPYQNLSLLKNIGLLKKLPCQILVGHSRKSYINSFSQASIVERDLETIAISQELHNLKIDYLRVHNVVDHQRFFVATSVL